MELVGNVNDFSFDFRQTKRNIIKQCYILLLYSTITMCQYYEHLTIGYYRLKKLKTKQIKIQIHRIYSKKMNYILSVNKIC